jgi:hypothetical protein
MNTSNPSPARFDSTLQADAELAQRLTGWRVFDYRPPFWRFGRTNHYYAFEAGGEGRRNAADRIVDAAVKIAIQPDTLLYRIRLNPRADESISTPTAFDPPPEELRREFGRWDDAAKPVLYVADDIELCLHECRTTIADEIVVATVTPSKPLTLVDLSERLPSDGGTPFDDPSYFIGIMCRSRDDEWLSYSRELAASALAAGYDGIRYKSYYSQAKHSSSSLNLAIFGRPLSDGRMKLVSINRLRITDSTYQFQYGPVLYRDTQMQQQLDRHMSQAKRAVRIYRVYKALVRLPILGPFVDRYWPYKWRAIR